MTETASAFFFFSFLFCLVHTHSHMPPITKMALLSCTLDDRAFIQKVLCSDAGTTVMHLNRSLIMLLLLQVLFPGIHLPVWDYRK